MDAEGRGSSKPEGSNQEGLPFAVYVLNDSVKTMRHVSQILVKVCSLLAHEAETAMLALHYQGKSCVFEASTEDKALKVQTKLLQAGLTTEIQRVED